MPKRNAYITRKWWPEHERQDMTPAHGLGPRYRNRRIGSIQPARARRRCDPRRAHGAEI